MKTVLWCLCACLVVTAAQKGLDGRGAEIHVNDTELRQILEEAREEQYMLVKFYAKWCPFSQQLEPVYAAVAKAFPQLPVLSIDASKYNGLNYRYAIYGFPKVILFKGGTANATQSTTNSTDNSTKHDGNTNNSNNNKHEDFADNSLMVSAHVHKRYHGNRTYESLVDFVSTWTKLQPLSDVKVEYPPSGRATPEADVYLYLSALFLVLLLLYSLYVTFQTTIQNWFVAPHTALAPQEHDKVE